MGFLVVDPSTGDLVIPGQRHAGTPRSHPATQPTFETRPRCRHCQWKGRILWHVCPRCGNIDWRYIAGHNDDRQGMYCRLGCGAHWMPDDPDWLAQRLPDD